MAALMLGRVVRRANYRAPRVFLPRRSLADLTDTQLGDYRLSRDLIREVVEGYSASEWANKTQRSHALSCETEVLVALRFYAKGGFLSEIAAQHGISKATVSRVIERVSSYLTSVAPEHIRMPRERHEHIQNSQEFHEMRNFPGVIGCIDGTHVRILGPKDQEWAYVNRKSDHSINTQIVCDANLKILNLVARWPGSCHDSFILQQSTLFEEFENGMHNGYWLLGDAGYGARRWLVTPILNPEGRAQRRFNAAHKTTRCTIERCIGVLKSRFRCLHRTSGILQFPPSSCCKIIMSCGVLHNMCVDAKLPQPEIIPDEEVPEDDTIHDARDGVMLRERLVNGFDY